MVAHSFKWGWRLKGGGTWLRGENIIDAGELKQIFLKYKHFTLFNKFKHTPGRKVVLPGLLLRK